MNQVEKFFEGNSIRIQVINNVTWFCAKDICDLLGYNHVTNTLSKLPEKYINTECKIFTSRRELRQSPFINKHGLVRLIYRSNLHTDTVEQFQEWVEKVIVEVLENGRYEHPIKDKNYYHDKQKKLNYDMYTDAYKFFKEIGDERYQSICLDNVKNLTNKNNVPMIENKEKLISISERIYNDMKKTLNKADHNRLTLLGKAIKGYYILRYHADPPKCLKFCNQHNTYINCYKLSDYEEWIDREINNFYNF